MPFWSRRTARPSLVPGAPVWLWPAALGVAALAGWVARRWGFPVRHLVTERDHVSAGPPVPPLDAPGRAPVQAEDDGTGPRYHRRYHVDIADAVLTPEEIVARIAADLNDFCPSEIARFEKTSGDPDRLAVGDDLLVHIASPWNGPVRVADVTPASFTLATLEGHMEAGQIRFSAETLAGAPGTVRFTIESWARSSDAVVDALYDKLGLARGVQGAMWTYFCQRVAETSGGSEHTEVVVLTEREADHDDASADDEAGA